MLDTAGLAATIQEHLDDVARHRPTRSTPFAGQPPRAPSPSTLARTTLYRIAAEALANVSRTPPRARPTVGVELDEDGDRLLLRVVDNGVGHHAGHADDTREIDFGISMMAEHGGDGGRLVPGETATTPGARDDGGGLGARGLDPSERRPRGETRRGSDAADTRADR